MKNNSADIFKSFSRKLYSFIANRVSSVEDAEDILQEVFLRFLQAEETHPVGQVSAWLYKVARSRIIDFRRKRHEESMPQDVSQAEDGAFIKEVTDVLIDEGQSSDKAYLCELVWEELEQALDELPTEQRVVFEQTELDGVSFKELSEKTNIPINTLLSRKHYAIKYLREQLKDIYEDLLDDKS
ncbi:MAG: RNA polymerase sigma factor [Bacteroidaceae bacterium]